MSETQASKPPEPSVHAKPLTSEKQNLAMVQATINEKWIAPPVTVETPVVLKFRIAKSREIFNIQVDQGSGNYLYDSAALRAVNSANPFPPFPTDLPKEYLAVTDRFISK